MVADIASLCSKSNAKVVYYHNTIQSSKLEADFTYRCSSFYPDIDSNIRQVIEGNSGLLDSRAAAWCIAHRVKVSAVCLLHDAGR